MSTSYSHTDDTPSGLRNLFFISYLNAENSHVFRSRASTLLEKKRHLTLPYFVIHPFSPFILFWDIWMTLLYFFAFLFIPVEACNIFFTMFNPKNFVNYGILVIFVHVFFMLDMIIQFFTGYVEPMRRKICLERKKIAWRYLSTYFVFDVLSTTIALTNAIPIYFISGKALAPKIMFLNMLKIVRVKTMSDIGEKIAIRFRFFGVHYKLFRIFIASILFFHWIACLIFMLPFTLTTVTTYSYNCWIHTINADLADYPHWKFYIASLFTAINLALTCATSTRAETMVDFYTSLFYACLGMMYTCFLFVQFLDVIRSMMEPETKYDEFVTQLRDYMSYNQLPPNIQQRMFLFYEHKYQRTFFKETLINSTLSSNLCRDIKHCGVYKLMSKVVLFKNIDPNTINEILDEFTVRIYLPKDVIQRSQAPNRYIYFINFGTVAVYTISGEEVKHMHDGDYFGTTSLLTKNSHPSASAISIGITEVYLLDSEIFRKVLRTDPDTYDRVLKQSKKRIIQFKTAEARRRESYDISPSKKELIDED